MSLFHNSRRMEEIALAWHIWGIFVSLAGFAASLASLGVALSMQEPLLLLPGLYLYFFWACVFSALCFGAGVLFHVWAAAQHRKHLLSLDEDGQ